MSKVLVATFLGENMNKAFKAFKKGRKDKQLTIRADGGVIELTTENACFMVGGKIEQVFSVSVEFAPFVKAWEAFYTFIDTDGKKRKMEVRIDVEIDFTAQTIRLFTPSEYRDHQGVMQPCLYPEAGREFIFSFTEGLDAIPSWKYHRTPIFSLYPFFVLSDGMQILGKCKIEALRMDLEDGEFCLTGRTGSLTYTMFCDAKEMNKPFHMGLSPDSAKQISLLLSEDDYEFLVFHEDENTLLIQTNRWRLVIPTLDNVDIEPVTPQSLPDYFTVVAPFTTFFGKNEVECYQNGWGIVTGKQIIFHTPT